MKLRTSSLINKQVWFIIIAVFIGGGLIYFLNSIGVIEAMRNDNTLDFVYEANLKLPKAPPFNQKSVTTAFDVDINGVNVESALKREKDISQIDAIIKNSMNNFVNNGVKNNEQKYAALPPHNSNINSKYAEPIIPHIIHQTWDSFQVPKSFIGNIKSWVKQHPGWEYWFWTTKAVKCFLERYYSNYVVLFDSYPNPTSKADAMRYFILHRFGGLYVDIDTRCLKPMDIWSQKFCCLLTEEPYEHSFIVREENKTSIVNSPMACQPGHKLFTKAISLLSEYAGNYFGDYLHSTGPLFLADMYNLVNREKASVVKHNKHEQNRLQNDCEITIAPPKYFLPRYDPNQEELIEGRCSVTEYKKLPKAQRQVCLDLIDRDYQNSVTPNAFMDHDWLHVALLGPDWKSANTISFFDILPQAKNLETYFCSS